jgi:hypothetical protein
MGRLIFFSDEDLEFLSQVMKYTTVHNHKDFETRRLVMLRLGIEAKPYDKWSVSNFERGSTGDLD